MRVRSPRCARWPWRSSREHRFASRRSRPTSRACSTNRGSTRCWRTPWDCWRWRWPPSASSAPSPTASNSARLELGIRLALGARPSHIVGTVLGSSGHALLAGLAVGLAGAVASARVIRVFLFGSTPFDPAAYAAVAVILLAAGHSGHGLPCAPGHADRSPHRAAMRVSRRSRGAGDRGSRLEVGGYGDRRWLSGFSYLQAD